MGFFSGGGIGNILGGGSSGTQGTSQSTTGFQNLPTQIQQPYLNYGDALNGVIQGGNLTSMYTPDALSGGETNAINTLENGTAPTADSINSDIAMQQNPYQQDVINQINSQYAGQNSLTNQGLEAAGQQNSNRSVLGANDIDMQRTNQIGSMLSTQYNTALQNALTTLPQDRQTSATDALGAGSYARGVDLQRSEAPLTALQQYGTALGALPSSTSGGTTNTTTGATKGNALTGASNLASIAALF